MVNYDRYLNLPHIASIVRSIGRGKFYTLTSSVQREIATRYLSKDGTAGAERAYVFSHDGGDTGRACHWWTVLDDPDGQSEKAWWFQTDASQFNFGLVTAHEARLHHYPVTAGSRHDDYSWTTDAAGNRYIAAVLTTEDMGNPGQVQKKVEQTRDVYGNVTQTKICLLSRICGVILVPGVAPSCDKGQFP